MQTKFTQLPFEYGRLEAAGHVDIALRPTLAAGILVSLSGAGGAHALVENSVEVRTQTIINFLIFVALIAKRNASSSQLFCGGW